MIVSNISSNSNNNNSKAYLNCEQTDKLEQILNNPVPICPSTSSLPTLNIKPRYFLRQILNKLKEHSIEITSIRLNGGAASYVLIDGSNFAYRDLDILLHIKTPLSSQQKTTLFSSNNEPYLCDVWTIIKYIICSCLLEHIKNATSTNQQSSQQYTQHYVSMILDTYAKKSIKISSEQNSWALLSLQNYSGQNLEFKFVEHLKRQWQFSVDSFQINLEPLLYEKSIINHSNRHSSHLCKCSSISSITKTIKTKNVVIDAINGLTIIKKDYNDEQNDLKNSNETICQNNHSLTSTSPIQFGFFTPSSSPNQIEQENNIECQTLATITTIATSNNNNRE
jgi:hypothetical protein